MRIQILAIALLGLIASPALALQGSDSCATAQAIAGSGTFNFDCTSATTGPEGQTEGLCYAFSTSAVDFDVWFEWTSDFSGAAVVTSCAGTSEDTKIAAYPGGGCPVANSSLACNDDACNLQSTISFNVVSGSTYMIQLGNFPGSSPASPGTFEIHENLPVQYPGNGHYYLAVRETVPWDVAKANAEAMTYLGMQGHLATYSDLAEDQWVYSTMTGGPLGNAWIGLYQDMTDPNYSEPAGGWVWVDGTPLTFTNWYTPSEPNNGGGLEHYGGYWPGDQWNDYQIADAAAATYVVEFDTSTSTSFCPGDSTGTGCPCGNTGGSGEGCANGGGSGGVLVASGSSSVALADFALSASGLIPGQPGLYFQGNNAINAGLGVQFGDGLRCAGGGVIRLQVRFAGGAGASSTTANLVALGGVVPGDTKRYQLWYRDPITSPCGALFNLSNGVERTFQP
jgi:hypothetical protein